MDIKEFTEVFGCFKGKNNCMKCEMPTLCAITKNLESTLNTSLFLWNEKKLKKEKKYRCCYFFRKSLAIYDVCKTWHKCNVCKKPTIPTELCEELNNFVLLFSEEATDARE